MIRLMSPLKYVTLVIVICFYNGKHQHGGRAIYMPNTVLVYGDCLVSLYKRSLLTFQLSGLVIRD
jgi:hypothetical protein